MSKSTAIALFLVAATILGAVASRGTPSISPDSRFYLRLADAVRDGHLEQFMTTEQASWTVITFPLMLAAARTVAGEHWAWVMVAVNVLAAAATALLLVILVRLVTRSSIAAGFAFVFYIASYEIVSWLTFIITDMTYSALMLATFLVAVWGLMKPEDRSLRRRVLLALLLFACFITRPAGAILIPLVLFTELLRSRRVGVMVAVVVAAAVVVLFIRAWFFTDMQRWPFAFMKPKLVEYAEREKTGEVVWDRKETFRPPPTTLGDHLAIEASRFVRFFQFTTAGFSRAHNAINVVYFLPLYLLAGFGVLQGLRDEDRRRRNVVAAALVWITGTAWFHAITILDFDWRYRVPLLPLFLLLAACGVDAIVRRRSVAQPWPAR
jgi:hypothetical protein